MCVQCVTFFRRFLSNLQLIGQFTWVWKPRKFWFDLMVCVSLDNIFYFQFCDDKKKKCEREHSLALLRVIESPSGLCWYIRWYLSIQLVDEEFLLAIILFLRGVCQSIWNWMFKISSSRNNFVFVHLILCSVDQINEHVGHHQLFTNIGTSVSRFHLNK